MRVKNTVTKLETFNDYAAEIYAGLQPKLTDKVRSPARTRTRNATLC